MFDFSKPLDMMSSDLEKAVIAVFKKCNCIDHQGAKMKTHRYLIKITFFAFIAFSFTSQASTKPEKIPANILVAVGGQDVTGGKPLVAVSTDNGKKWGIRFNNGIGGDLRNVSCTGSGASVVCAATGDFGTLAVSTDDGDSWLTKSISNLPPNDQAGALDVSCTGSGTNTVCAAIGGDADDDNSLLFVSTDGGATWNNEPINGVTPYDLLKKISCTGSGVTAICVAAGDTFNANSQEVPLLVVSTDGAMTWNRITPISNFPGGYFNDVSCAGGNANPLCVAGGNAGIVTSLDGGNTWEVSSSTPVDKIDCNGTGAAAVCAAIATGTFGSVLVSQDEGNTWQSMSISNLPKTASQGGDWLGINCDASGNTCVVVGEYSINDNQDSSLIIATSTDGGSTWSTETISNPLEDGIFSGVNCTDLTSTTVCVATGGGGTLGNFYPVIADSLDGGITWKIKNITNLPATAGQFLATSSAN